MRQISALDYAFLALETAASPKHVAGLALFKLPQGASSNFLLDMLERMKKVAPTSPFDQTLTYSMLGIPRWQNAAEVDLDWHVRHVALPKPGGTQELMQLIARLHATRLDRSRPLWEFYLIEGLAKRAFALYFKIHHSYMDGLSMSRRITRTLNESADDASLIPIWGLKKRPRKTLPAESTLQDAFGDAIGLAATAVKSVPDFGRLAWSHSLKAVGLSADSIPVPFTAPRTRLNRPLTPPRSTAIADLSLPRLKRVSRKARVSINDVLLSACDGALQTYLDSVQATPDKPLVAQVPISVRKSSGKEAGNQITIALVELATGIPDPVERLRTISAQAKTVKSTFNAMSPFTGSAYTVLAQATAQLGELSPLAGQMPPLGNVIISNVIGPDEHLYLNGAELTGIYPLSTIGPGLTINITFYTYGNKVHVGIVAGRDAIPELQRVADCIVAEVQQLEEALQV